MFSTAVCVQYIFVYTKRCCNWQTAKGKPYVVKLYKCFTFYHANSKMEIRF